MTSAESNTYSVAERFMLYLRILAGRIEKNWMDEKFPMIPAVVSKMLQPLKYMCILKAFLETDEILKA